MSETYFLTEHGRKVLQWERNLFYQTPGIRELFYKENEVLIKEIDQDKTVLDVGCGLGTHLMLLSKYCKEAWGIDHSDIVLKHCRKETSERENIKTFKMNAKKLEFPDNCFDQTSCMFNTLGNMHEPLPVLREMKRVTKPGGRIVFSLYNLDSIPERLEFYHKTGMNETYAEGTIIKDDEDYYSRSYSEEEINELGKKVGLNIVIHKTRIGFVCEAVKPKG